MKIDKFKIALIDPLTQPQPNYIPTGLCYLSSYIKKAIGDKVIIKIFPVMAHRLNQISEFNPDLVAFSSLTHNFILVQKMAVELKQMNEDLPLLLGGQHISMAPWSMPAIFDYAILGEGEEAFLRFIQYIMDSSGQNLTNLNNLQYWDKSELKALPKLPMIEPLDQIPFPDRESIKGIEAIITQDSHRKFNRTGLRNMQLTTSRGCPFKCKFCQPSVMWDKFRMHSPEYIAEEINYIYLKYNINAIHIEDDLFISSKKRITELIDLLNKKNLLKKIVYYIAGRTKQIDPELVELLQQLGVAKVEFGIESGSDRISNYLKGGSAGAEINKHAISLLNDAGIAVYASFIAGSPPETWEDFELTRSMIKWIKRSGKLNTCGLSFATPLPGTYLWDYAVRKGLIDPGNFDWEMLNTLARAPKDKSELIYLNENIPPEDLLKIVKRINLHMYLGTPREFLLSIPRRMVKIPRKINNLVTRKF